MSSDSLHSAGISVSQAANSYDPDYDRLCWTGFGWVWGSQQILEHPHTLRSAQRDRYTLRCVLTGSTFVYV